MKRLGVLLAGAVAVVAAGVALVLLRPARCDGRLHARAELLAGEPGPDGEYEFPLSRDGCLKVRYSTRRGGRVGLTVFEELPDGDERVRLSTTVAEGAAEWGPHWATLELPPLPDRWYPTDLTTLTWYRYSEAGAPLERVERTYENRGQIITEQRFRHEAGGWLAGEPHTVRLDVGPDRFLPDVR